jgi:hypothetical protein
VAAAQDKHKARGRHAQHNAAKQRTCRTVGISPHEPVFTTSLVRVLLLALNLTL